MECKEVLKMFMQTQVALNHLFDEDIDRINEELHEQDNVNETITDCLSAMTERMNGIENRLNKLEKEKRNATNK